MTRPIFYKRSENFFLLDIGITQSKNILYELFKYAAIGLQKTFHKVLNKNAPHISVLMRAFSDV